MVTFPNGDAFRCKVASGAWGFAARGYPEIFCSFRGVPALLRIPLRHWPGVLRTVFGLWLEMVLLFLGVLSHRTYAFTTKTLSLKPIAGNPLEAWIRVVPGGYVNAVGLANPGLIDWIANTLPSLARRGIRPIVSIAPNSIGEVRMMIQMLHSVKEMIRGIELNPGCPNTEEGRRMFEDPKAVIEISEAARVTLIQLAWDCPLILKLSSAHDWRTIVTRTQENVDAFELINSVPWKMRYGDLPSPLKAFGGGGVSGQKIFPMMLSIVQEARMITTKPIFACGGIDSIEFARSAFAAGADGVTIGTGFISNALRLARLPDDLGV